MTANGIAISIDALLAMILTIAFIGFIGIGMQGKEETTTKATTRISQTAEDVFTALDKSGYLTEQLVDRAPLETGVDAIYSRAADMLPPSTGLRVEIKEYIPQDDLGEAGIPGTCKEEKDLATCFPSSGQTLLKSGETIPTNKEVLHGRKMQIMRQPVPDSEVKCKVITQLEEAKSEEKQPIMLQGNGQSDKQLTTQIMVKNQDGATPSVINCDDTVTVTAKMRSSRRDPVAIILAMDESLSMKTYDMLQGEINNGTLSGGTCNTKTCGTGTCTNFGNWKTLGTLKISQDLMDKVINKMPSAGFIYFIATATKTTGACGKTPRLRVKSPTGFYYTEEGREGATYVYKGSIATGDWVVEGWSDTEVTAGVEINILWGWDAVISSYYSQIGIGTIENGTATGEDEECADYGNFQNIGTFTIDDAISGVQVQKIDGAALTDATVSTYGAHGRFEYSNYGGKCTFLKAKVKYPGMPEQWFPAENTLGCKNDGTYCVNYYEAKGTQLPGGDYEIYAWSDFRMGYTSKYRFSKNISPNIDPQIISGGTYSDSSEFAPCGNYTGYQDLGFFTVSENDWKGLLVKLDTGTYMGKCSSPRMELTGPGYVFSASINTGCTSTGCRICLNENDPNGACDFPYTVKSDGVPVAVGDWSVKAWNDSPQGSLYTLKWFTSRIDNARKSATSFVDSLATNWKTSDPVPAKNDTIGAISYSNAINKESALNTDRALVKTNVLNQLSPFGQTATGDAIKRATVLLSIAEEGKKRILILLTDGRANLCENGRSSNCDEAAAATYAIDQANLARNSEITIYVVGFADRSIMTGSTYEMILQQIAGDCTTIYKSATNCGGYYYAADAEQLIEALTLIKGKVLQKYGRVEITFPFPNGMELMQMPGFDSGRYGVWNDDTGDFKSFGNLTSSNWLELERQIVLDSAAIDTDSINHLPPYWFAVQFNAKMPCNGAYCLLDYVLFPPKRGSKLKDVPHIYDSDDLLSPNDMWPGSCDGTIVENCCTDTCTGNYMRIPFKYSNLKIKFLDGDIITQDSVSLDLNIANVGHKDVSFTTGEPPSTLKVAFYVGNAGTAKTVTCSGSTPCTLTLKDWLGVVTATAVSVSVPTNALKLQNITFCNGREGGCPPYTGGKTREARVDNIGVSGIQKIYAKINEDKTILECSENNEAIIECPPKPRFKFYTIDYYVWGK